MAGFFRGVATGALRQSNVLFEQKRAEEAEIRAEKRQAETRARLTEAETFQHLIKQQNAARLEASRENKEQKKLDAEAKRMAQIHGIDVAQAKHGLLNKWSMEDWITASKSTKSVRRIPSTTGVSPDNSQIAPPQINMDGPSPLERISSTIIEKTAPVNTFPSVQAEEVTRDGKQTFVGEIPQPAVSEAAPVQEPFTQEAPSAILPPNMVPVQNAQEQLAEMLGTDTDTSVQSLSAVTGRPVEEVATYDWRQIVASTKGNPYITDSQRELFSSLAANEYIQEEEEVNNLVSVVLDPTSEGSTNLKAWQQSEANRISYELNGVNFTTSVINGVTTYRPTPGNRKDAAKLRAHGLTMIYNDAYMRHGFSDPSFPQTNVQNAVAKAKMYSKDVENVYSIVTAAQNEVSSLPKYKNMARETGAKQERLRGQYKVAVRDKLAARFKDMAEQNGWKETKEEQIYKYFVGMRNTLPRFSNNELDNQIVTRYIMNSKDTIFFNGIAKYAYR